MVDVSASFSESSTQGFQSETGPFTVGGDSGTKWLPLALVALAALAAWWYFDN